MTAYSENGDLNKLGYREKYIRLKYNPNPTFIYIYKYKCQIDIKLVIGEHALRWSKI